jgi:hypothetical protein
LYCVLLFVLFFVLFYSDYCFIFILVFFFNTLLVLRVRSSVHIVSFFISPRAHTLIINIIYVMGCFNRLYIKERCLLFILFCVCEVLCFVITLIHIVRKIFFYIQSLCPTIIYYVVRLLFYCWGKVYFFCLFIFYIYIPFQPIYYMLLVLLKGKTHLVAFFLCWLRFNYK